MIPDAGAEMFARGVMGTFEVHKGTWAATKVNLVMNVAQTSGRTPEQAAALVNGVLAGAERGSRKIMRIGFAVLGGGLVCWLIVLWMFSTPGGLGGSNTLAVVTGLLIGGAVMVRVGGQLGGKAFMQVRKWRKIRAMPDMPGL